MTMFRSTLRMFSFAIPLLVGAAPALLAQNRPLFTWTGRVDREVQITMRGRDVWTNGVDRDDGARSRVRVGSPLPRTDGYVRLETSGRGEVTVAQQPASWNNYTTIVRIIDRGSGSDRYNVSAYWESRYADDRGGYGRDNGGYGRDNGGYGRDNGSYGRRDGDDDDDSDDRGGLPSRIDPRDRNNGGSNNGGWNKGGWHNGNGGWNNGSGTALRWSGSVDNEVEIRLNGRRMDERVLAGGQVLNERSSIVDGLPRRDAQLVISQRQGRGTVYVAQQPTAYNGYTAIIRVRDPQGGYGYYDFTADYR